MTSETTTREPALAFTVADMSCGHCVRAITASIVRALPGADVEVDLPSKRVVVRGTADSAAVTAAIASEGYSPEPAAI